MPKQAPKAERTQLLKMMMLTAADFHKNGYATAGDDLQRTLNALQLQDNPLYEHFSKVSGGPLLRMEKRIIAHALIVGAVAGMVVDRQRIKALGDESLYNLLEESDEDKKPA